MGTYTQTQKLAGSHKHAVTFEVQGRGAFPCDMLRYDACFPLRDIDAHAIQRSDDGSRDVVTVRLTRTAERANWEPTAGRWSSFGWSVRPAHYWSAVD
jgi:hypothetical protein